MVRPSGCSRTAEGILLSTAILYQIYIEFAIVGDKIVGMSNYGQALDGTRVRALRRERSLSQGELALLAGTTQATISEIERNLRRVQYRTTRSLAAALGVKPRDLLGEENSNDVHKNPEDKEPVHGQGVRVPPDRRVCLAGWP